MKVVMYTVLVVVSVERVERERLDIFFKNKRMLGIGNPCVWYMDNLNLAKRAAVSVPSA